MKGITEERLRGLIEYDPDTGIVRRKLARGKFKKGSICSGTTKGNTEKLYGCIEIDGKKYKMHRVIWLYMTGSFPNDTIDHINGNGMDNRWVNLRDVSRRDNSLNRKLQYNNISGLHGVTWHKTQMKWQVGIYTNDGYKYVGKFDNIFDAACARKNAEVLNGYHVNHGKTIQTADLIGK